MSRMINTDSSSLILSIIIPVYNVEAYIKRCLDSVVNLAIPNYEVIVVNDGTEDDSMDIVKKYAQEHNNIFITNQENQGLGEARNTGLRKAKGEYVYFLDSDDYIEPSAFISLFNSRLSSVDIVIGDYSIEENNNISHGVYKIETNSILQMNGKDFFSRFYRKNINTMVWRSIYRKDFLISNNLFFTKGIFHEDINWTPKVILSANKIVYLPLSFYFYQIRSGSIINSTLTDKKFYDQLIAYYDLLNLFVCNSRKIKKELNYIITVGVLVNLGKYWNILNHKKVINDIKPLLTFDSPCYFRILLLKKLFLLFPLVIGKLLNIKYGY